MHKATQNNKAIRRRRSDPTWKRSSTASQKSNNSNATEIIDYPAGPIRINTSWNPVNRKEKPPYSYANIIAHAILTSQERKLTLNDIYGWIRENYPYYTNDSQGWQNSIRHNLSLHKSFFRIERDPTAQNPPRKGSFWTIRAGKEQSFIDNLQKPVNSIKRQQIVSPSAEPPARRFSNSNSASYDGTSVGGSPQTPPTATLPMIGDSLFNTFRATNKLPEPEPIASSSDHILSSSPTSSSSMLGSPSYCQLLTDVPDSAVSYSVYPEGHTPAHNELFGDRQSIAHHDNIGTSHYDYTGNNSSYLTENHAPSLSPGDPYSTAPSLIDKNNSQYFSYSTGSPDLFYNNNHKHHHRHSDSSGSIYSTQSDSNRLYHSQSTPSLMDTNGSFTNKATLSVAVSAPIDPYSSYSKDFNHNIVYHGSSISSLMNDPTLFYNNTSSTIHNNSNHAIANWNHPLSDSQRRLQHTSVIGFKNANSHIKPSEMLYTTAPATTTTPSPAYNTFLHPHDNNNNMSNIINNRFSGNGASNFQR